MKSHTLLRIMAAAAFAALLPSCEEETIMFDSSMNVVGFSSSELKVNENQTTAGSVTLYLGATEGSEATTATLEVDTVGLGVRAAKQGIDFTLESTTVQLDAGEKAFNLINIVDNDQFTGDKKFYLVIKSNSKNYRISAQKKILVIIKDDEHPLKNWIGTYTVEAASYGKPGEWDETWTVVTEPVEGDVTQLRLLGICTSAAEPIIATLNTEDMTITIQGNQSLGDPYDFAHITIYKGIADLTFNLADPIIGILQPNGNMDIDLLGLKIMDGAYEGEAYDVFNTSWIKE